MADQDLAAELAACKAAITEANNSLYGSQGFFLSTNGGDPDKYHLARPIENLKASSNRLWRENQDLRDALECILEVHGALGSGQSHSARKAEAALAKARGEQA